MTATVGDMGTAWISAVSATQDSLDQTAMPALLLRYVILALNLFLYSTVKKNMMIRLYTFEIIHDSDSVSYL